jgi:NH3-dependent NAD+ synthetase
MQSKGQTLSLDYVKVEKEIIKFIRKIVDDSGSKGAVIGLSGGIDSSVVGALLVRALGKDKVVGILMPASHTPKQDTEDGRLLAKTWGIKLYDLSIDPFFSAFEESLPKGGTKIAYANVKARIRMIINYYVANVHGMLVAGTGDKSEDEIGFFCYDDETRVVTKEGPKRRGELKVGDVVFSFDPATQRVVEEPVSAVHEFDYDGDLIHFRSQNVDLLVTPNHRMLARTSSGEPSYNRTRFRRAEECVKRKFTVVPVPTGWAGSVRVPSEMRLTFKQRHLERSVSIAIEDVCYLIGLFIGDGSTTKGVARVPVKSELSRAEAIARGRSQSGRFLGLPQEQQRPFLKSYDTFETDFSLPAKSKDGARTRLVKILEKYSIGYSLTENLVRVSSREIFEFFRQCGVGAHHKKIPSWVLEYPSEYLAFVLRGLKDSDGNHSSPVEVYYTSSEQLKDDFVELCVKMGRLPTVRRRPARVAHYQGKTIRSGPSYEICYAKGARNSRWITSSRCRRPNYRGKVWCPSVPPHENLLVERNGRYIFSGNTKYGDGGVDFLPIAHLYKTQVRELGAHLGLPAHVVNKPSSPQLWPGHKAVDEIPIDYDKLDPVLVGLFDEKLPPREVARKTGVDFKVVQDVVRRHASSAHKRSYPPMIGGW